MSNELDYALQKIRALGSRVEALEQVAALGAKSGAVAPGYTDLDWPEDFAQENGRYTNCCCECKQAFIGLKGRAVCKKCVDKKVAAMRATPALKFKPGDKVRVTWGEYQTCTGTVTEYDPKLRLHRVEIPLAKETRVLWFAPDCLEPAMMAPPVLPHCFLDRVREQVKAAQDSEAYDVSVNTDDLEYLLNLINHYEQSQKKES